MNNTARTSIIAIAALAVGGLAGYGYNASLPVSVTSTDVAVSAPSGDAALGHARAGISHLDNAARAVGKGNLDKAAEELKIAKGDFSDVAKVNVHDQQPVLLAQEAVIVHQFTPSPDFVAVGSADANAADMAGMSLSKGRTTKPLALSDYSIIFGDLSVDTDLVTTHIDLAIQEAKAGKKSGVAEQIKQARGAISFAISGDDVAAK